MLAADVIRDARIDVLEHQVAAMTDALAVMMESYKMLVSTLALASVGEANSLPN